MTEPATHEIPVVDLHDLEGADPDRAAAAAEAVRVGFGEFGLVYIRNHGIDRGLLDGFYDELVRLFARPEEEKRSWARADIWYQRGWTPPNTEKAVVAGGQPDFKECYFAAPLPLHPETRELYPEVYAENSWPEDADAFREGYLALGAKLHRIGRALLRGCAHALDLPADLFDQAIEGGPHVTRALRYLALDESQVGGDILWGEEHTDFNLLTLLPGGQFMDPEGAVCPRPDPESGLYLRTRPTPEHPRGRKVLGTPPAGCIVAQVGQQLEILTGGTLLATPHVITAPRQPGYTRCSMAHFIHLHSEQRLFPLDRFRTSETIRAYGPPVLAGTYGLKTLVDIGLAPPEAIDKLGYRHYDRLAGIRAEEDAG